MEEYVYTIPSKFFERKMSGIPHPYHMQNLSSLLSSSMSCHELILLLRRHHRPRSHLASVLLPRRQSWWWCDSLCSLRGVESSSLDFVVVLHHEFQYFRLFVGLHDHHPHDLSLDGFQLPCRELELINVIKSNSKLRIMTRTRVVAYKSESEEQN